jgi:hypothetical protein
MAEYTAAEIERRSISAMGELLGRVYHWLWNECSGVHWKWAEFVTHFGTNDARVDLLMRRRPGSFGSWSCPCSMTSCCTSTG